MAGDDQKVCAICLENVKAGDGEALFTAECSHVYHFRCITLSVKHGRNSCPICRAEWNDIPTFNPINPNRNIPPRQRETVHATAPPFITSNLQIQTFTEFPAIPASETRNNFSVLIHLKAPSSSSSSSSMSHEEDRAPLDLVTVLDVSGSMAGSKLQLLKQAMSFVIQNLSPNDRLSVVAFSTNARTLFPLKAMTGAGSSEALQAVNSLVAGGTTNIAQGLQKAADALEQDHVVTAWTNVRNRHVRSIILLSDGQDNENSMNGRADYSVMLPPSIRQTTNQIPIHAFGIGSDHDSTLMHWISEATGGTFSFIEHNHVIQDAFAQCIGGLLSVVIQELQITIECVATGLKINLIQSGSYANHITDQGARTGMVDVGDLYAEEQRDFLVDIKIPPIAAPNVRYVLVKISCRYMDLISQQIVNVRDHEVTIERPARITDPRQNVLCLQVDAQRNRLRFVQAMSAAREAAEHGNFSGAMSVLSTERTMLQSSKASMAGDSTSKELDAELNVLQERMANTRVYESSGRAYTLSAVTANSRQRATTRGDSLHGLLPAGSGTSSNYQTSMMSKMVMKSQEFKPPPPPAASSSASGTSTARPSRSRKGYFGLFDHDAA